MTRLQVQAAVALLLIVTALLLYSASLKSVPKTQWRQPRVAPWTYNMSAIDNVETVGYPNSLLTYGANKEAPEFVPQPEKGARILIFAYARSGSSMTGKFLSQGLRAPNYVYEPLALFETDIKNLTKRIGLKEAPSYLAEKYREELMSVFSTGRPNENSFHADRATSGINVTDGGDVITKTIRLRYVHLRGWVENQDTFKVIHLVRDPRGMLASMLRSKLTWLQKIASFKDNCDQMLDDLTMAKSMPRSRYVRVRYEDLVSEEPNQTKMILDELYEFMGIPFDLEAQNSTLGYLMHGESHASHRQYYALFRDSDFDPNHWTKELSREQLSHAEEWCGGVIQELGYPLFNATTTQSTSTSSNKMSRTNPAVGNMFPG